MSLPLDPHSSVREIAHGSRDYDEVCQARDRMLRRPLGLSLSAADCDGEATQRHFVLEAGDRLLGGVIVRPAGRQGVQLRQMWVEADRTGEGLGRMLLEEVTRRLEADGIRQLVLHARQPVLGFYRKCGFHEEGAEFVEVGIPHRKMRRLLSPETRSPGCHR